MDKIWMKRTKFEHITRDIECAENLVTLWQVTSNNTSVPTKRTPKAPSKAPSKALKKIKIKV